MSISVEWNKEGLAKMLDNPKVKETIDGQVEKILRLADTPITNIEEPTIDTWRETHIDYSERLGEANKSISIETFLTFDELLKLCRCLVGVGNDGA